MPQGLHTHHVERRGHLRLMQGGQDARRVVRMGTVVKGEGNQWGCRRHRPDNSAPTSPQRPAGLTCCVADVLVTARVVSATHEHVRVSRRAHGHAERPEQPGADDGATGGTRYRHAPTVGNSTARGGALGTSFRPVRVPVDEVRRTATILGAVRRRPSEIAARGNAEWPSSVCPSAGGHAAPERRYLVVDCNSCKGSRSCVHCLGRGVTHGDTGTVRCGRCFGTGECPVCQQVRPQDLVSRARRLPRGVVKEDLEVHAVRRWVGGDQALCGAGPIATRLSGDFEPGRPGTCGDCGHLARR